MRELALFAGAGGGILGGHLLGWRTVCAVECEVEDQEDVETPKGEARPSSYARDVLVARQDDGTLAPFPIWDDVRTFDGGPWQGRVDVVSGGFPCQDISAAGKGAGIDGERSGLWGHMSRVVREVRPRFVVVENSPMLTSRGLGRVLGDLAALGFDAEWCVLGADDCGAPHRRKRIWIAAHANGEFVRVTEGARRGRAEAKLADDGNARLVANPDRGRFEVERGGGVLDREWPTLGDNTHGRGRQVSDANSVGREAREGLREARPATGGDPGRESRRGGYAGQWPTEPNVGRVAHGVAARVDRLRAIGNGQVPRVAAAAFELLRARGGW